MDAPAWTGEWVARHGEAAASVVARAATVLADACDPGRGWMDLMAVAEADGGQLARLHGDGQAVEALLRLGQASRYAAEVIASDPEALWLALAARGQVFGRAGVERALAGLMDAAADEAGRRAALARTRDRQHVRILLGDLDGRLRFAQVVEELSDVADALIGAALRLAARGRGAEGDGGLCVLALGKHGGREVNYSSDIDLVFTCADGADLELATRVGIELIRILERPAHGVMYRIDMRLRPEGDRGALVLARRELLDYYWSAGRPWERQALIKARACAGDLATGRALLAELAAWIYPAEVRWDELDESRRMRRRIEERALTANLKTAAGGIRDIEFLCQYFQLLYGGGDPGLRTGTTLRALARLRERGILPRADADALEAAYIRLRTIEHRLQHWEDRQVHELPSDPAERRALAWRCGERDLAAFDAGVARMREQVRVLAERHFLDTASDHDTWLHLVVQGAAPGGRAGELLRAAGLRDTEAAAAHLRALAREPFFLLTRDRTERALVRLAPLLLACIQRTPDPDLTLANLVRIADSVGGRATFFDLLGAQPDALAMIVDIAGRSGFLVDLLALTPGLADELAEVLPRGAPPAAVLAAQARAIAAGLADARPALRFLQARELLAAAVLDLRAEGDPDPRRSGPDAQLTALAEAVSGEVLRRALGERARAWGVPMQDGRPCRMAVLAAGKAGGGELGYVGDLDVLYICDPGGTCPRDPERGGGEFFTRVAQQFARDLDGLYEVDARLRPWGEQGPLVADTASLAAYWAEEREVWERLAMMRAAGLAGDPGLIAEAVAVLRAAAIARPPPADAAEQVRAMRQRLEATVAGHDDLKRGPGGYVDIEFTAQYRLLGASPEHLPVRLGTATALAWLAARERIPAAAAAELIPALRMLRRTESRLRLMLGSAESASAGHGSRLPRDEPLRLRLARLAGFAGIADLDQALAAARTTARTWYDRLVA